MLRPARRWPLVRRTTAASSGSAQRSPFGLRPETADERGVRAAKRTIRRRLPSVARPHRVDGPAGAGRLRPALQCSRRGPVDAAGGAALQPRAAQTAAERAFPEWRGARLRRGRQPSRRSARRRHQCSCGGAGRNSGRAAKRASATPAKRCAASPSLAHLPQRSAICYSRSFTTTLRPERRVLPKPLAPLWCFCGTEVRRSLEVPCEHGAVSPSLAQLVDASAPDAGGRRRNDGPAAPPIAAPAHLALGVAHRRAAVVAQPFNTALAAVRRRGGRGVAGRRFCRGAHRRSASGAARRTARTRLQTGARSQRVDRGPCQFCRSPRRRISRSAWRTGSSMAPAPPRNSAHRPPRSDEASGTARRDAVSRAGKRRRERSAGARERAPGRRGLDSVTAANRGATSASRRGGDLMHIRERPGCYPPERPPAC